MFLYNVYLYIVLERDMKYLELNYKPIDGWSNYVVTSCGRVFNKETGKEVAQVLSGKPQYKYVNLQRDKQRKLLRVHRLVALAFLPTVEGKAFVDHIDRDKMNNNASNLRWATASENSRNMANNRMLVCGGFAQDLLTANELNFAERNNLLILPVEDIKTVYSVCKELGGTYQLLTKEVTINNETHSAATWCIYLNTNYKTFISNANKVGMTYSWKADTKDSGVTVYQRKTKKELIKESDQRTAARKLGISVDEYLNRDTRKMVVINGEEVLYHSRVELCSILKVSEDRVRMRMKRKGMTLEQALQAPPERVNKYLYNGVVYSIKDLCSLLSGDRVSPRKFNKYKAKYGEIFLEKLGIYGVDIQPYFL